MEAFSRKIDGCCGLVPDAIEDVFESTRVLRAEVPLAQLREYLVEEFLDLRDNDYKRAESFLDSFIFLAMIAREKIVLQITIRALGVGRVRLG